MTKRLRTADIIKVVKKFKTDRSSGKLIVLFENGKIRSFRTEETVRST